MAKRIKLDENVSSLFPLEDTPGLAVVQAQFAGVQSYSIADLFQGYETLDPIGTHTLRKTFGYHAINPGWIWRSFSKS